MPSRPWLVAAAATLALAAFAAGLPSGAPTAANQLGGVSMVAAGGDHTCALLATGGVECWGDNHYGELGDGSTADRSNPVAVSGLSSGVAAIAAGSNHTCALLDTGAVKCWGYNRYGQLGNGTATGADAANPTPVDVSGLSGGVAAITAGGSHTCALLNTGGVTCWGWNRRGQIGDGQDCSTGQCRRLVPSDVTGLASGAVAIDAGIYHTCALLSTGGVACWGQNDTGQLGTTTGSPCVDEQLVPLACAPTPVDVLGLTGVTGLAAGEAHTCALLDAGGVTCWGSNASGQLGDGGACGSTCGSPVDVAGLAPAAAIDAGNQHTCAFAQEQAAVSCWGANGLGQLGNGDSPNGALGPVEVCAEPSCAPVCIPEEPCGPLRDVIALSLGRGHSCAATGGQEARCWGDNALGQLGDGQGCGSACDTPNTVLAAKATPTPTATVPPTPTPTPAARVGDANCDGVANSIDALLVLQYVAGLLGSLPCPANADVNGGGVSAIDAALVLQYVAGLLPSLP